MRVLGVFSEEKQGRIKKESLISSSMIASVGLISQSVRHKNQSLRSEVSSLPHAERVEKSKLVDGLMSL